MLILGIDRRIFFVLLTSSFALFVVMSALLSSLLLFVVLWSGAKLARSIDPAFFRLRGTPGGRVAGTIPQNSPPPGEGA
jgi:hypothetical protein